MLAVTHKWTPLNLDGEGGGYWKVFVRIVPVSRFPRKKRLTRTHSIRFVVDGFYYGQHDDRRVESRGSAREKRSKTEWQQTAEHERGRRKKPDDSIPAKWLKTVRIDCQHGIGLVRPFCDRTNSNTIVIYFRGVAYDTRKDVWKLAVREREILRNVYDNVYIYTYTRDVNDDWSGWGCIGECYDRRGGSEKKNKKCPLDRPREANEKTS